MCWSRSTFARMDAALIAAMHRFTTYDSGDRQLQLWRMWTIHQHVPGLHRKGAYRTGHGQQTGPQHIQLLYLCHRRPSHAAGQSLTAYLHGQRCASGRTQTFGIIQSGNGPTCIQYHCGGTHRASQRTPTGLVHSGCALSN